MARTPVDRIESFRRQYRQDLDCGQRRTLDEYLALFPGDSESLARAWFTLDEGPWPSAGEGPSAAGGDLGPYRILRELGRGGQATVHLALDTRLQRRVALKILNGIGPSSGTAIERFRREAELASRLEHPGICGVHDAGIIGSVPFIAMHFIEGVTLARRIAGTAVEAGDGKPTSECLALEDSGAGLEADAQGTHHRSPSGRQDPRPPPERPRPRSLRTRAPPPTAAPAA